MIAKKLNEPFASVFTVAAAGQMLMPDLIFSGRESEELTQWKQHEMDVLGLIDALNI